jgi:hypothetical protein
VEDEPGPPARHGVERREVEVHLVEREERRARVARERHVELVLGALRERDLELGALEEVVERNDVLEGAERQLLGVDEDRGEVRHLR